MELITEGNNKAKRNQTSPSDEMILLLLFKFFMRPGASPRIPLSLLATAPKVTNLPAGRQETPPETWRRSMLHDILS